MDERVIAFKVGFLQKVAEMGKTPDEFYGLVKQGFDPSDLLGMASSGLSGLGGIASAGGKGLLYGGIGLPIVAGGALGAADAALNAPSGDDIEGLRKAEMLGLLHRLTTEVRGRQAKSMAR
jgi:hypothetical protein